MTNHWVDIRNVNLVMVMGGNAIEAHPVGFHWAMEAKIHNGAKLIVTDPRSTCMASVADFYTPIRPGTDITFLSGVILYLLNSEEFNHEYTEVCTNASLVVREGYSFDDGLFSGYNAERRQYGKASWNYELNENGFVKYDTMLQYLRCVWSLLKQHVPRYTPNVVENTCGTPKADFLKVCEHTAETSVPDKAALFLYALGWTQYSIGAQNIRAMAMVRLLLGSMGMTGGGADALCGHSNIQGLIDFGLLSTSLSSYMSLPNEKQADLQTYLTANTPKPLLKDQVNYQGNYPKFLVPTMKTFFSGKVTAGNSWGFGWLLRWDENYDALQYFEMTNQGKVDGYICQGFNPVASLPNKNKVMASLSRLEFLVTIDPLNTETSTFWQNHGESSDVDPSKIQTEVLRLPSTCFAGENGPIANSGHWLQWHWRGADVPGIVVTDGKVLVGILTRLRKVCAEEGGPVPEPMSNTTWNYSTPHEPAPKEVAMESSGKTLADIIDPATGAVIVRKGQQLSSFAQLRDDDTASSGCWIFTGSWTPDGNQTTRRDNADPPGLGSTLGWAWAWLLNRRILYNRASADPQGKLWDSEHQLLEWDGTRWGGVDIPNYSAAVSGSGIDPFIMQPEGMGRPFVIDRIAEGPSPEHYKPFKTPLGTSPLYPNVVSNPATCVFKGDLEQMDEADKFPYVGTTCHLTGHFHYWTRHALPNVITQPEQLVEIGERLANKLGIGHDDTVKVSSNRGYIKAKAVVIKRIRTLRIDGRDTDTIGIPIYWSYGGIAKKGFTVNTLTPFVGSANTQTPKFKAFFVNVEKV